ncbi:uncharacterized protein LOC127835466 [Dreissena polymorpha]|uniref:B box-type domain-containing protein n=1 Tax=Dreissena polymorpha TaxID=45954 RepID=A0A9D4JDM2_DREPO|nr:uncharacterized protein LOC127835466 [Dreissena polymorpha]KAH3805894.1 hypothetical protein DPMN_134204 [Dreissena polymorpha]
MASEFETSVYKGSDTTHDYPCESCDENGINNEADVYCENCSKFFCNNCLKHHNNMYKKHIAFGRQNSTKWFTTKRTDYALELCQDHKSETMQLLCEDHDQLLCTVCHVYSHQQCHVKLISDVVTSLKHKADVEKLTAKLETLHGKLARKKQALEESIQSLETSYNKILEEIHTLREEINEYLDTLESYTVTELDALLSDARTSLQDDILDCKQVIEDMNDAHHNMQRITSKSDTLQFITYKDCHKYLVKAKSMITRIAGKNEVTIEFQPDADFTETLSTLLGLGKVYHVRQSSTEPSTKSYPKIYDPVNCSSQYADIELLSDVNNTKSISISQSADDSKTRDVNRPKLVLNPEYSSTSHIDHGSKTIDVTKQKLIFNPVSSSSRHIDHDSKTSDVTKPNKVSNPESSSNSNLGNGSKTSDVTEPKILSNPESSFTSNLDNGSKTSDVNKPKVVFNPKLSSTSNLDHGSKISDVTEPKKESNQELSSNRHIDNDSKTCDGTKPKMAANQTLGFIRHLNHGSKASDVTEPKLVPKSASSLTSQLEHVSLNSDFNKPAPQSDQDYITLEGITTEYSVTMKRDLYVSVITGICETASGQFLITDFSNKKVKLLDQCYKVVAHCDMPDRPLCICSIGSSLAAVAAYASSKSISKKLIMFIRVKNDKIVIQKKLKLKHECKCIAYHKGNLYITSGRALFLYTEDGTLVWKMYEDNSGNTNETVTACAVSPNGDRIYLTNDHSNHLITLSTIHCTVISKLDLNVLKMRSELAQPVLYGLHVTAMGNVLVCGGLSSNSIVQVDKHGIEVLATVVTEEDGVKSPTSVYFSQQTGSLIVGMWNKDSILVLNMKYLNI